MSAEPAHNLTASFPSAGEGVASEECVTSSPGFIPLTDLLPAFAGCSPEARRKSAERWCHTLSGAQRRRHGGRLAVYSGARLPDGLTVEAYLRGGRVDQLAGFPPPPGHERWSDKDRQRFLNSHELLKLFDDCKCGTAAPAVNDIQAFALFQARLGERAAELGFKRLSLRTLRRIRRRLDPNAGDAFDGNVRRSRRGEIRRECDPDAWDFFKSLWLTPQRRKVTLCWEITKVEAEKHGWSWPALRTIQKRVEDDLPPFFADRYRLGELAWSRKHAPRIERDLSAIRPNHCWIGDHAQFDFLILHDGKPVRPWLTAWEDQRSRVIVGWQITLGPDSDTILAAFRDAAVERGVPNQVIIDNGKDYKQKHLSGGRRGKPRLNEDYARSVFGRLDIHVTFCEKFNPGSKAIESFFNGMHERFDKLFDSYCGGSPDKRPEELYKRLRADEVALPTLSELVEFFIAWLDAYHRRPHSGDGMEGLCPFDAFERFDPIAKRTAPRETLDLLLRKAVKVTVTRKGVRHNNVPFGQGNRKLLTMHGKKVLLRLDPDSADRVEVCDLDGRRLTWARNDRLRGVKPLDIKRGKRRQKRARQLAAAAAPAFRDARKSVIEHAIAAQAEHNQQLRQAAGAETAPAQRGLALIQSAALVVAPPDLTDVDEPGEPAALDWAEPEYTDDVGARIELDWKNADDQPREGTVGDLLGQLEFDDDE